MSHNVVLKSFKELKTITTIKFEFKAKSFIANMRYSSWSVHALIDSYLVTRQASKEYKARDKDLAKFKAKVKETSSKLLRFEIVKMS